MVFIVALFTSVVATSFAHFLILKNNNNDNAFAKTNDLPRWNVDRKKEVGWIGLFLNVIIEQLPWGECVSHFERLVFGECMDSKSVKRYDTVRAIAIGLAKEAGISTDIEVKVFNATSLLKDSGPFTGPCLSQKPWLALPQSFVESAPLSNVCFALSHEIGHIYNEDCRRRYEILYLRRVMCLCPILALPVSAPLALLTATAALSLGPVISRNRRRRDEILADAHAMRQCGSECGVHFFDPVALTKNYWLWWFAIIRMKFSHPQEPQISPASREGWGGGEMRRAMGAWQAWWASHPSQQVRIAAFTAAQAPGLTRYSSPGPPRVLNH